MKECSVVWRTKWLNNSKINDIINILISLVIVDLSLCSLLQLSMKIQELTCMRNVMTQKLNAEHMQPSSTCEHFLQECPTVKEGSWLFFFFTLYLQEFPYSSTHFIIKFLIRSHTMFQFTKCATENRSMFHVPCAMLTPVP